MRAARVPGRENDGVQFGQRDDKKSPTETG